MSLATVLHKKALSLIVVWMLAASLLVGIGSLFAAPAAAQNCDRSGVPTPGDWIVTDAQVCESIVIVMDGDLIIQGVGSLTIRNGGLKFVQDTAHVYGISVAATSSLTFENSKLWTETNLINPYMMLTLTVSGTLTLDDSTFAFPGTIATAAGAQVVVRNGSVIRRTEADVNQVFGTGTPTTDDNNDGPGLTFVSSTVSFYASRVEDLYENATGGFAGDPRQHIRLQGAALFTAVDTFLAIDFCCTTGAVDTHNTLDLAGTSRAYLYGVTTDASENPAQQSSWVSAILTGAGTAAYVYRWADVSVVDANGVPVAGADVDAMFSGPETGPANYSDNGGAAIPPGILLTYLGETVTSWDDTDVAGRARMPLIADWIDSSTQPDSRFVGTFTLDATLGADTGSASLTFPAYPAMDDASASSPVTITLGTLTLPLPDLIPTQPTFNPATPLEGDTVTITAFVGNQGNGGAANVLVRVFDGTTLLSEQTISFIAAGATGNVTATLPNATAGTHIIRVFVDPTDAIIEGPGAGAETNNIGGFPLSVTRKGPDLAVDLTFDPSPGFMNNPVSLRASVTNIGDGNATNVRVNFYQQELEPNGADTPLGTVTLPFVDTANPAFAVLNWTPTSLGDFRFWAWVDPLRAIPEPPPYDDDVNNKDTNVLTVTAAPDLVVLTQDLTMTDPFPRAGVSGTIEAVVRNAGQAAAGAFRVDFFVDGLYAGSQNLGGLGVGAKVSVSLPLVTFGTCGFHSIEILVDPANQVSEGPLGGPYESNNRVTRSIQAYHPTQFVTWGGVGTIDADFALASSIEITGTVTVSSARLSVVQDQDPCGRYYLKVLGTGRLVLQNAEVTSNWPLMVFVASGGQLTAADSTFTLDVQGKGVLHSKGTLDVRRSTVLGDLVAKGTSADLRGDTFRGSLLHVDTAQMSRIWDSSFPGVTTIELQSDALGALTVDFDIRNVTFSAALTDQLVFSGDQFTQFTSVTLTKPGDWWTGMLTQSAHIRRYWWLTVETVDGTDTRIEDSSTSVGLTRFNPTNLAWEDLPDCSPDECYYNSNNSLQGGGMVGVPQGVLLYRAAAEDRYGASPPSVRATYRATGWADIEGRDRYPDEDVSALMTANVTATLRFSELTPDLHVTAITFSGDNGAGVNSQPIGRPLTIIATVANEGQIITRNVLVNCYATDVDINRDGYMDNPHSFYNTAGLFIGSAGPLNVSALSTVPFPQSWTPPGISEGSRTVSCVADPSIPDPRAGGAVAELSETNNLWASTVTIFTWPDLHLASNPILSIDPPTIIEDNNVTLEIRISNEGTNTAVTARIGLFTTADVPLGSSVTFTLQKGLSTTVDLVWMPQAAGLQTIRVRVEAAGGIDPGDFRNWDFDLTDNAADLTLDVKTQPELTVALRGAAPSPFRAQAFNVTLYVNNSGQTAAPRIAVTVADAAAPTVILGFTYDIDAVPGSVNVTVRVTVGIVTLGDHTLLVKVDANNSIREPDETNNQALIVVSVIAPTGTVILDAPAQGLSFQPGDRISVRGYVRQTGGARIPGVNVSASLVNAADTVVVSDSQDTASDGSFSIGLTVPAGLAGDYTIRVEAPNDPSISQATTSIRIARILSIWETPFLGLPVWIWLIVIIGAAAAIGGGTAYVKFVGLGKLVECGECGAFIAEDSVKCPKCGVEFEKDMAKCSNCQAWIPVDVKQCPECGVEFMTGEVEMADYEAQMRKQYDEVKKKFREEASRELGRAMTDREFDDWWRTQPTFVTFEDWLREEEEMRRMGSKPCPTCNTLNSVTATVCHKCGTLLKEEKRPAGRPTAPARPAPSAPAQPPVGGAPEGEEAAGVAMPGEAIPKKVVKKPVVGAPIVQKKVIKRPLEEEKKEGEGGEGTGGEEEQI